MISTSRESKSQQKMDAYVHKIASMGDLPAFANDVFELTSTMADQEASLSRLTNIILRNLSLTAKLLRLVNSAFFNRSGRQILSVSTAVTLLGWNTIRDLAAGLMLFDQFQKQVAGVKDMILITLLTANHSKEISQRVHYPRIEEAYLCGMFASLGELLIANYFPDEYAKILEEIKVNNVHDYDACHKVLGFSYEDLGKAMVRHWKLPDKLCGGMAYVEKFAARSTHDADMLNLITSFSRALSTAVYRDYQDKGGERISFLLKRFGAALNLNEISLNGVLKDALSGTRELYSIAKVPLNEVELDKQIEKAMTNLVPGISLESDSRPTPSVAPSEKHEQEDTFSDLSREVESVLESGEEYSLNDLIMMILEAIYRGVGCSRVLFCLLEQDRSHVQGRMGVGEGSETLLPEFRFPVSLLSGPVGSAIVSKKDLFVEDIELTRHSQSKFAELLKARGFAVCPLIIDNIVIGCFYLDHTSSPLKISDRSKEILFRLRNHAADIIEKKRKAH
jgi:eukaryotic-like serine/threonine-protein kinase